MKGKLSVASSLFLCFILSCKKDVEPDRSDLNGAWLLIQTTIFNGQDVYMQDVPALPARTMTFSSKGELATVAISDSTLDQARYFKTGYNSLVGPVLDLYKTNKQPWVSFKYLMDKDTLVIQPFIGRTFSHKFRRL
jgi:hypothetical protein